MTMEAPITDESKDDRQRTGSSGQLNRGGFGVPFSCPMLKAGVRGAEIFRKLSHILPGVLPMVPMTISTLRRPAATLCACHAPGQNLEVRFCALDAAGRVITAHQVRYVGIAEPTKKPSSTGKNTGSGNRTKPGSDSTGNTTRRKSSTRKQENGEP